MSQEGAEKSAIKFGNYVVAASSEGRPLVLGTGSSGKTYKATHSFLGTTVALKVIQDSLAYDNEVKTRFINEARAIAQLKHSHIAQVTDCGEAEGTLYYAMEYCDGGDLEKFVKAQGALSDETALSLIQQAAEALAYVHDKGYLHRDLKPSNLMLSLVAGHDEAELKVIDFGLVKALGGSASGLTQRGQFRGTLLYTSPEQLQEKVLDERTDVFSLGMTLWFLLDGGLPIKDNAAQVVEQRLSGKSNADRISQDIHPSVRALLAKMIHPLPEERLRNMHEVAAEITRSLAEVHRSGGSQSIKKAEPRAESAPPLPKAEAPKTPPKAQESARPKVVAEPESHSGAIATTYEVLAEETDHQGSLGQRFRGRHLGKGEYVYLTLLSRHLATDAGVVRKLAEIVDQAKRCEGPFIVQPRALVRFTDQLALVEPVVRGFSLHELLKVRSMFSLVDASGILRQVAEACDAASTAGLNNLDLEAQGIRVEFQKPASRTITATEMEKMISFPVYRWLPYQLRVMPDYSAAPHASSDVTSRHHVIESTMLSSLDGEAGLPCLFARLTYRILSGVPVPAAATMSRAAYVSVPALSEEGNRLLARAISGESVFPACLPLLKQLWQAESLAETPLVLPNLDEEPPPLTFLNTPIPSGHTTRHHRPLNADTTKQEARPAAPSSKARETTSTQKGGLKRSPQQPPVPIVDQLPAFETGPLTRPVFAAPARKQREKDSEADYWGLREQTRQMTVPKSTPQPSSRAMQLLTLLEPLFLYVCEQHRIAQEHQHQPDVTDVRAEVDRRLEMLQSRAAHDPGLGQQIDVLRPQLLRFLDYTFAAPDELFGFRLDWHDQRLSSGEEAGDEKYFQMLDRELESPASDTAANERLLFYYVCLGLGFRGLYRRPSEEHRAKLRTYMQRLHGRVQRFMEGGSDNRLFPEAYDHLDTRDLVGVVRERPLIIAASMMALLAMLTFGYFLMYAYWSKDLNQALEHLRTQAPQISSETTPR